VTDTAAPAYELTALPNFEAWTLPWAPSACDPTASIMLRILEGTLCSCRSPTWSLRPNLNTLPHAVTRRQRCLFKARACPCTGPGQGVFIIEPEQRYTTPYRTTTTTTPSCCTPSASDRHAHLPTTLSIQARPLACVCTSGDVVPPIQDSVDWPTATPQPLACCPSPVPLTTTATRAPSCSIYANIVASVAPPSTPLSPPSPAQSCPPTHAL
jgi:hypothetical protein